MLRKLLAGELDEREIEFDVATQIGVEIMTPPGMEEMANQLQGMFQNMGGNKSKTAQDAYQGCHAVVD